MYFIILVVVMGIVFKMIQGRRIRVAGRPSMRGLGGGNDFLTGQFWFSVHVGVL